MDFRGGEVIAGGNVREAIRVMRSLPAIPILASAMRGAQLHIAH
jgi:hypothetical protein